MTADSETILVAETGLGRYQVEARAGDTTLLIDEPVSAGGLGSGPNPYNLLSAALGACTVMTLRLYANRKGWPLTRTQVSIHHTRVNLQSPDTFALEIALEGTLDETQRARLLEIAERCPVHLTLARGSAVRTTLLPAAFQAVLQVTPETGASHVTCMHQACAEQP